MATDDSGTTPAADSGTTPTTDSGTPSNEDSGAVANLDGAVEGGGSSGGTGNSSGCGCVTAGSQGTESRAGAFAGLLLGLAAFGRRRRARR